MDSRLSSSRLAMRSSPRWKRYSTWAPASSSARMRVYPLLGPKSRLEISTRYAGSRQISST
ncbi:MAG: hypothetical protein A3I03_03255 [Candidatus Rokubacteria bacterium RIFCSPLOWO2_02_FULL_68_19]|nr:MAG: hypothetical protein A3I03_03255 [Candidatus Rokubacteria bacterium RIFCSPLOWO2_02_FULL_68_19]